MHKNRSECEFPGASFKSVLWCRCPRCGEGSLYDGLLAVKAICEHCELDLEKYNIGDGASTIVIFILGLLVVPLVLLFETLAEPKVWMHFLVWPPVIILLGIFLLRPVKAALVANHYKGQF